MDPITLGIVTSLATNYFTEFTTPIVKEFFSKAISEKPEIEEKLQNVSTTRDLEEIFTEAADVIDASAETGDIEVLNSFLSAVRGIRFNHDQGTVFIQGTQMSAPILITGGGRGATGTTTIGGNTELKSGGTSIKVGQGASIRMSGDAQIRQY